MGLFARRAQLDVMKAVCDRLFQLAPFLEPQIVRLGRDRFIRLQTSGNTYIIASNETGHWSTAGVVTNPLTNDALGPPRDVRELAIPWDGAHSLVATAVLDAAVTQWVDQVDPADPESFKRVTAILKALRKNVGAFQEKGGGAAAAVYAWNVQQGLAVAILATRMDRLGVDLVTARERVTLLWSQLERVREQGEMGVDFETSPGWESVRVSFNSKSQRHEFMLGVPAELRGSASQGRVPARRSPRQRGPSRPGSTGSRTSTSTPSQPKPQPPSPVYGAGSLEHELGLMLTGKLGITDWRLEPSPYPQGEPGEVYLYVNLSERLLARVTSAPGHWTVHYYDSQRSNADGKPWFLEVATLGIATITQPATVADLVIDNTPPAYR